MPNTPEHSLELLRAARRELELLLPETRVRVGRWECRNSLRVQRAAQVKRALEPPELSGYPRPPECPKQAVVTPPLAELWPKAQLLARYMKLSLMQRGIYLLHLSLELRVSARP